MRDIKLSEVLNKLLEMLRNNHLRMKGSFYLGVKALTQVEAIGRSLNPDLNFINIGEPYAMRQIEANTSCAASSPSRGSSSAKASIFSKIFRTTFAKLYQRIKHGKINIPLQHKIDPEGFEPLRKTLDSIANRLTNAILDRLRLDLLEHSRAIGRSPQNWRRFNHWLGRAPLGDVHVPSARPFHLETRRAVAAWLMLLPPKANAAGIRLIPAFTAVAKSAPITTRLCWKSGECGV